MLLVTTDCIATRWSVGTGEVEGSKEAEVVDNSPRHTKSFRYFASAIIIWGVESSEFGVLAFWVALIRAFGKFLLVHCSCCGCVATKSLHLFVYYFFFLLLFR